MRAESSARLPRRRRQAAPIGDQIRRKDASAPLPQAKSPRSDLPARAEAAPVVVMVSVVCPSPATVSGLKEQVVRVFAGGVQAKPTEVLLVPSATV